MLYKRYPLAVAAVSLLFSYNVKHGSLQIEALEYEISNTSNWSYGPSHDT